MTTPLLPAFALEYGPSKIGKSTSALFSFPTARFIAAPGALKPSVNVVGYTPTDIVQATRFEEVGRHIQECAAQKRPIVIDDFSLLAEREVTEIEKKVSGWEVWRVLRRRLVALRDLARQAGVHVVLNCHESPPTMKDGRKIRGGPQLPAARLTEELPTLVDLIVRVQAAPDAPFGWKACYRCAGPADPEWITGDRHGVCPDRAPNNMAEVLRAAGFTIPRAPGLEWQEELAGKIAAALEGKLDQRGAVVEVLRAAQGWGERNHKEHLHMMWAIRDGVDRAVISAGRRAARNAMYGL